MKIYTKYTVFQRLLKCATLASIMQIVLMATLFNARVSMVQATLSPEMTSVGGDGAGDLTDSMTNAVGDYDEKRSWQSLQGPWGKRTLSGMWAVDPNEADDEVILAEHWPLPWVLTNADTLERLVNARLEAESANIGGAQSSEGIESNNGILNEKRTWKNMNAAWGKRRNAPAWNKFSGAWGKREPGWNNLKGMWGKRASKDWGKLHGGWGKRSQTFGTLY